MASTAGRICGRWEALLLNWLDSSTQPVNLLPRCWSWWWQGWAWPLGRLEADWLLLEAAHCPACSGLGRLAHPRGLCSGVPALLGRTQPVLSRARWFSKRRKRRVSQPGRARAVELRVSGAEFRVTGLCCASLGERGRGRALLQVPRSPRVLGEMSV